MSAVVLHVARHAPFMKTLHQAARFIAEREFPPPGLDAGVTYRIAATTAGGITLIARTARTRHDAEEIFGAAVASCPGCTVTLCVGDMREILR